MPTLSDFRARFPEFAKTSDALIQSQMDGAALECNEDSYGNLYSEAVLYLTAHRIASSPYGQTSRSKDAGKTTTYQINFERIQALTDVGLRVL